MDRESVMWDIFMQTGSIGAYLLYKHFEELSHFKQEEESRLIASDLTVPNGEKEI